MGNCMVATLPAASERIKVPDTFYLCANWHIQRPSLAHKSIRRTPSDGGFAPQNRSFYAKNGKGA